MKKAIDLEKFQRIRNFIEEKERDVNRAEGALGQLLPKLKKEFKCKDLKEAQKLLEEIDEDVKAAADECEKLLKPFEEKYGEHL